MCPARLVLRQRLNITSSLKERLQLCSIVNEFMPRECLAPVAFLVCKCPNASGRLPYLNDGYLNCLELNCLDG